MGRFLIVLAAFAFVPAVPAVHPAAGVIALAQNNALSMEQQSKVADLVTKEARPLPHVNFSIAVDAVVPPDIPVHPLPKEADTIAPQLRGFGYVVVEEQIALVDQQTRKIGFVIQRGRVQNKG